jgi:hypothetical protein
LYLDLFDELRLNKRLVKIAGFEVAAYWAELQSILKQVVKKQTADERGFFTLDRDYVERETTLSITKQLKCEEKLLSLGVLLKDPAEPNRISIAVNGMVAVITDEDTTKLKKSGSAQADAKAAKIAGMKATMKKAILETDIEIRAAYERWVDGMIDAANCRFTKAVVQLFEKTITEYTTDRALRLKIIEIATVNSYRDAGWAIERAVKTTFNPGPGAFKSFGVKLPEQKICSGVSDTIF